MKFQDIDDIQIGKYFVFQRSGNTANGQYPIEFDILKNIVNTKSVIRYEMETTCQYSNWEYVFITSFDSVTDALRWISDRAIIAEFID